MIFLIECRQSFENCFCVSMGANKTEYYDAAFRFEGRDILVCTKNQEFERVFAAFPKAGFTPEFVVKNRKKLAVPVIDAADLPKIHALPMWTEISEKCIGCGGCNMVCGSCSCFDTADVIYGQKSRNGERRRIWAGCMQEDFTKVAGGGNVRAMTSDRMRFKVLHKIYGFNARFSSGHMCVGCGRCDAACPEQISYFDTINRLGAELLKGRVESK